MDKNKPNNIAEYKKWLKDSHNIEINDRTQTYYESVAHKIRSDFINSLFWQTVVKQLERIAQEYYLETKYYLFIENRAPKLELKPFSSLLLKSFRHNIINNKSWPKEPGSGWIFPSNWFIETKDIVRTCFVVKYLDGTSFLLAKIEDICEANDLTFNVDFEAKEEGYYAAHLSIGFQCEIPRKDWDTEKINVVIELQVTTQIQEVIRKLLHKYYEKSRKRVAPDELKWQWDYKSDEFSANYLGHILHYVEGMIMDVRHKQEGIKN